MKIVILDGKCAKQNDLSYDRLNELGEVIYYDRTAKEDVVKRIGDAEIVLTNKVLITKEIIDACPNLKYISVLATGFNIIDTNYAKEKGILVSNVPGYSTDSVVQLTFAFILNFASNVNIHNNSVKSGDWASSKDFMYTTAPLFELAGKTIGIIGYGAIGKKVAAVAKSFGMNVIYTKAHQDENSVSLDEVFKNSDIISLHCPQTKENAKFINSENIAKMKDGVILINTARGGIVNEEDLARALTSGKIKGYATDVLSSEPPSANNPLIFAPNSIITPHIAWATKEARTRLLNITYDNIKAFLGNNPINIVNN